MFFFIAGIQPKTVSLDNSPVVCPSCGLARARLMRLDHYFSAFFIPLFRVKKGERFLRCPQCGDLPESRSRLDSIPPGRRTDICPVCGAPLERSFQFCPYCGNPV